MTELETIAHKAIEILETEGWAKHWYYNKGEGYCLAGAIYKAAGYDVKTSTKYRPVFDYGSDALIKTAPIFKEITKRLGTLTSIWNDNPERTKEEVINFLKTVK